MLSIRATPDVLTTDHRGDRWRTLGTVRAYALEERASIDYGPMDNLIDCMHRQRVAGPR